MKTNEVEITLVSKRCGRKHSFKLVQHEGEDAVFVVNGKAVASINVETMTKDVRDEDGDYHTKPSDNFFICFSAVEAVAKKECAAMAWVEPAPVSAE